MNKRGTKAFTILELLIVVAIIAILAIIVTPNFIGAIDRSRTSQELADLNAVDKAVSMYYIEKGEYPTIQPDQPTYGNPENIDFSKIYPTYISKLPHFSYWMVDYRGRIYHEKYKPGTINGSELTLDENYTYKVYDLDGHEVLNYSGTSVDFTQYSKVIPIDNKGKELPALTSAFKGIVEHPEAASETNTTQPINHKPIPSIVMSPEQGLTTNTTIEWTYTFTDEDGDKITNTEWQGTQDTYTTAGTYTVKLKVQDEHGLWSDQVEKQFTVVEAGPITLNLDLSKITTTSLYGDIAYTTANGIIDVTGTQAHDLNNWVSTSNRLAIDQIPDLNTMKNFTITANITSHGGGFKGGGVGIFTGNDTLMSYSIISHHSNTYEKWNDLKIRTDSDYTTVNYYGSPVEYTTTAKFQYSSTDKSLSVYINNTLVKTITLTDTEVFSGFGIVADTYTGYSWMPFKINSISIEYETKQPNDGTDNGQVIEPPYTPLAVELIDNSSSLTFKGTNTNYSGTSASISKSTGKWYWEVKVDNGYPAGGIGVAPSTWVSRGSYVFGYGATEYSLNVDGRKMNLYKCATYMDSAIKTGDILGFALDMDNKTISAYKNGVGYGIMFSGLGNTAMKPAFLIYTTTPQVTFNFGATPFEYSIPDGFLPYNHS